MRRSPGLYSNEYSVLMQERLSQATDGREGPGSEARVCGAVLPCLSSKRLVH